MRHLEHKRQEFEDTALLYMERVYNAAFRLTRNKAEAEDLLQETFLRAYRFFHQFQPGSNCRAWLLKIMHNLFITRLRQSSHALVGFDEQEVYWEARPSNGASNNPEVDALRLLARENIQQALGLLPPKFRAVVVLADLEGCTYREIAEICHCPIGTVMSRLYRGRRALRDTLRELGTN